MRKHTKSKCYNLRFSCDVCSFQARQKYTLRRHVQLKHEEIREKVAYACDYCDHSFKSPGGLKIHIMSNHNKVTNNSPLKLKQEYINVFKNVCD